MSEPLLVFAGVATEDSLARVHDFPQSDERVIAEDMSFGGGGPAATAAVAAARLGVSAAVVATVGDDDLGSVVKQRLAAEGVDVSGVQAVEGAKTSRSIVIVSGEARSRAIINQPGPPLDLEHHQAGHELIERAAWVHVDQHGWNPVKRHLAALGERGGQAVFPQLSIDGGNSIAGLTLDATELYVPALPAARARFGFESSMQELLRAALREGAQRVVITDGGNGAYAAERDSPPVHIRPPSTQIRSTLGAGDVFHGALLAALVHASQGQIPAGLAAATAYATTVAALSCRGLDSRSRIPDHEETLRHVPDHSIT